MGKVRGKAAHLCCFFSVGLVLLCSTWALWWVQRDSMKEGLPIFLMVTNCTHENAQHFFLHFGRSHQPARRAIVLFIWALEALPTETWSNDRCTRGRLSVRPLVVGDEAIFRSVDTFWKSLVFSKKFGTGGRGTDLTTESSKAHILWLRE